MKYAFNLQTATKLLIQSLVDSEFKKKKALLITDNAGLEESVRKELIDAINHAGDEHPMDKTIIDALQVDGMKEYIDTIREEALASLQSDLNAKDAALQDANQNVQTLTDRISELEAQVSELEAIKDQLKQRLVSDIVDYSTVLRVPEIDMEHIDDSRQALESTLKEVEDMAELESKLSDLHTRLEESFKTPVASVNNPVQVTDPQKPSSSSDADTNDGNNVEDAKIVDMRTLLRKLHTNKPNKTE